jgi:serine/threonine-protein phosphatase 4 regulatory subunit 1
MMLNPDAIPLSANGTEASPDPNAALRFEDLTIDDDLSLLERVVRYVRSGIALQRLVHVKMIAETAKAVG